jgi:hypothetical protein
MQNTKNAHYIIEQSSSNNTWHKGGKGAAINVGKNKAIAQIIIQYAEHYKIPFKTVEPKGFSSYYVLKIGRKETFLKEQFEKDHNWQLKTTPDSRAAVAIIWANKHLYKPLKV